MDLPETDIVSVVYALLPGFLAAWIFYALTAHPPKSPFERVVQALIFTGIIKGVVIVYGSMLLFVGNLIAFGEWTTDVAFAWSIFFGVLLGVLFSLIANKDWFHSFLRDSKWLKPINGLTKRTSYPSEWYSAFNRDKRYVVLHLKNGRRLYGWPYEWPDAPDSGHFVIVEPEWLLSDGNRVPLHTIERVLICATDVEMVEFEKLCSEVNANADEIESASKILTDLNEVSEYEKATA